MSISKEELAQWEQVLSDAGLPPEPEPQRNTVALLKDPSQDFLTDKSFFERNSDAIFEAKQQWKEVPLSVCVCLHCGVRFQERKGTKFCCPNHRKRHDEGKTYSHIMCEGCGGEIFPVFDDVTTIEGKKLCPRCVYVRKALSNFGVSSIEEFRAKYNDKHEEYLARVNEQWEHLKEMYR